MSIFSVAHEDLIKRTLLEDLGRGEDITSQAVIPYGTEARAVLRTRENGILAGAQMAQITFSHICDQIKITHHAKDGEAIKAGQDIMVIEGSAQAILAAERTALNFMIHLSGIATETNKYVEAIKDTKANIVCTRKTLPGLRAIQKYAVKMGGGSNHRFGLDDGVLIKDNHIALAGSIGSAIECSRKYAGHMVKIEIEVDTLEQLEEVLDHKIDVVMLDNMEPDTMREAVNIINGRALSEASGGINLETVRNVAETGIDIISVGALTHSAKALDIGLDIDKF